MKLRGMSEIVSVSMRALRRLAVATRRIQQEHQRDHGGMIVETALLTSMLAAVCIAAVVALGGIPVRANCRAIAALSGNHLPLVLQVDRDTWVCLVQQSRRSYVDLFTGTTY